MHRALALAALFVCLLSVGVGSARRPADAATSSIFTVNSTADVPDVNPGNGVCETGVNNHLCTLRAGDSIHISPVTPLKVERLEAKHLLVLHTIMNPFTGEIVDAADPATPALLDWT